MTATPPTAAPPAHGLLVLLFGLVLYVSFLGTRDLWYPDEPDVAESAREMLERGDWVTPTHDGRPWIDYPPLAYWLGMAASLALGGMSEFALRLPSALAAVLLALGVWRFGSARLSPRAGLWGAFVLLTFPHFVYQGVHVHPDMLFAAGQAGGLLLYAAAEGAAGRRARTFRVGAFALFGLAVLAKGPLGLLLPGLVLTVWHLLRREGRRLLALAPLSLVALAVALPWYAFLAERHGLDWVRTELVEQNLSRFGRPTERGHGRPWHYYLAHVGPDLGLWVAFLAVAGVRAARGRGEGGGVRRFLWVWAATMFLFLHLAATKREAYLLPAYPAFALLVGDLVASAFPPRARYGTVPAGAVLRHATRAGAVAALLVAAGAFVLALRPALLADRLARSNEAVREALASLGPAHAAIGVVAWAAAVTGFLALRRDRPALLPVGVLVVHAGVLLVLVALVLPRLDPPQTYRPHAAWLAERLAPGEPLGVHAPGKEDARTMALLYYGRLPLRRLATREDLLGFLSSRPDALAIVEEALAPPGAREVGRFRVANHRWVVLAGP